jgi:hypothetical protein
VRSVFLMRCSDRSAHTVHKSRSKMVQTEVFSVNCKFTHEYRSLVLYRTRIAFTDIQLLIYSCLKPYTGFCTVLKVQIGFSSLNAFKVIYRQ